jgi:hypothetical protein
MKLPAWLSRFFTRPAAPAKAASGQRMYAGAKSGRLMFSAPTGSANTELYSSLATLRARSRALCRDVVYAKRARTVVVNNVIGQGMGIQAQVMNNRKRLMDEVNDPIEHAWRQWSLADTCHTGGSLHFGDLERGRHGRGVRSRRSADPPASRPLRRRPHPPGPGTHRSRAPGRRFRDQAPGRRPRHPGRGARRLRPPGGLLHPPPAPQRDAPHPWPPTRRDPARAGRRHHPPQDHRTLAPDPRRALAACRHHPPQPVGRVRGSRRGGRPHRRLKSRILREPGRRPLRPGRRRRKRHPQRHRRSRRVHQPAARLQVQQLGPELPQRGVRPLHPQHPARHRRRRGRQLRKPVARLQPEQLQQQPPGPAGRPGPVAHPASLVDPRLPRTPARPMVAGRRAVPRRAHRHDGLRQRPRPLRSLQVQGARLELGGPHQGSGRLQGSRTGRLHHQNPGHRHDRRRRRPGRRHPRTPARAGHARRRRPGNRHHPRRRTRAGPGARAPAEPDNEDEEDDPDAGGQPARVYTFKRDHE